MRVESGTTDVITYFKLIDPSTGVPETGLTITDLDMTYVRDQAAAVKVDATAHGAVTDAHADNEMIEVDATNCPGLYRADWQDVAFAAGVDRVQLCINGSAIDPAYIEVELFDTEQEACQAALDATFTFTGADVNATLDGELVGLADDAITSAKYDESTAFPVKSDDSGATQIARVGADGDTLETLSDQLDAKADTGAEMNLADNAITSGKYDELTAFPVVQIDSGASQIARTGADGDTLEDLSDEIAVVDGDLAAVANSVTIMAGWLVAVKLVTDVIPNAGALTDIDTGVSAIQTKTDNLPADPASETNVDATETKLDSLMVTVGVAGVGLNNLGGMSAGMKAEVNAECDTAVETYRLNELMTLALTGQPTAGSMFADLTEDDAGTQRFNANALEEAPSGSGGDATEAKQDTIIAELADMAGATFATGTDSLEAIRDRGDVAWITGGSGSGANQVDLTIEVAVGPVPIPDVKISVMNSDSTVLIATGTSDTNGEATFALDDGTYKILLSRIGFTFTVPETLVVDESPETATYNGTQVSVGSPPSADACRMYEYCVDQDGDALSSVTSYCAITDRPYDDGAGAYETQKVPGTYDSGTGLLYWDIVKGAIVTVEIKEIGLYKKYTVPDQANARLGDLTPE